MKLSKRLEGLIGHEFIVKSAIEFDEINVHSVSLEEVGDDYVEVSIRLTDATERRIYNLANVIFLAHRAGCEKCAGK